MKLIFIIFCMFLSTVQSSDLAKEQRWADQTVDSIIDGDAVWLLVDDLKFLSIYTEAENDSDKGMIVVHGTGIHPNWDQVIQPVRVEMTTHGWNTLSIQMPILHNEATYDEYLPLYAEVAPRIKAAENYLKEQGVKKIVIVAHSQGAAMSSYYLSKNKSNVSAFVAIGLSSRQTKGPYDSAVALKNISMPVYDVYGSDDLPTVLNSTAERKAASKHNKQYSQIEIPHAGHFFEGKNGILINTIQQWLRQW
jgi:predicted alpha/beta hydrolase family esterase